MRIDFISDVACPWCAVGLNALEIALARLPDLDATLHFQPFELNPQMSPEGEDANEHLMRKYGIDAAQVAKNREALRQRGESVGFTFTGRDRVWNTFDAHRLLHEAALHAPEVQRRLKHALLEAYHTHGLSPADPAVLLRAAVEAGVPEGDAIQVLQSDRHTEAVREAERQWQEAGIRAVPSVVIDGRHLIQGGQPPEVFEQALESLWLGRAAEAPAAR